MQSWMRDVSGPHPLDELRDRFRAVLIFDQPVLVGTNTRAVSSSSMSCV